MTRFVYGIYIKTIHNYMFCKAKLKIGVIPFFYIHGKAV